MNICIAQNLKIPNSNSHEFPIVELLVKESNGVTMVSSVEASDIVVVPTSIQYLFLHGKQKEFYNISEATKNAGKQLLVFTGSDYGKTLLDAHIIQVRLGGFKSKMNPNTFVMPPFINDPYLTLQKEYTALHKKEKPTIGFVGHSNGSALKLLKEFLLFLRGNVKRLVGLDKTDIQSFYPSSRKRFNYLELLANAPGLMSNFRYRKQYRAGAVSVEDKQKTTKEFYENIHDNLYTFCLRGTGNFSVRFYETLAMGRIPVFVNTDSKLPFETFINWNEHAVIIEEKQVRKLPEILEQFHLKYSKDDLVKMQDKNRALWQDFFQKELYFKTLIKQLKIK